MTRRGAREGLLGWALVLPALALIGLFTLWPLVQAGISSLYRNDLSTAVPQFIGLGNYKALLGDRVFWKALGNNLVFALATVALSMAIALCFALLAHHARSGLRPSLQLAWFLPTVIPMVAAANIWLFIYTPSYGLLDSVLKAIVDPIAALFRLPAYSSGNWLGNPSSVMPSLIAMYVWKEAGYFMLFFLVGLERIDRQYYEAARLDGAGNWTVFRRITAPLLMPTALFVLIIACTTAFKTVDHLVIMTKGGPDNASNLLLYYTYQTAFSFWDIGKASALTVCLLALLSVLIALNLRYFDRRIHYSD